MSVKLYRVPTLSLKIGKSVIDFAQLTVIVLEALLGQSLIASLMDPSKEDLNEE